MRRLFKRLGIFSAIVLLIGVVRFPASSLLEDFRLRLERDSQAAGLPLKIQSLEYRFPLTILVRDISVGIPTQSFFSIPIAFSDGSVSGVLRRFLSLRTVVQGNFHGYDGETTFQANRSLVDKTFQTTFVADALKIEKHPLAQVFGISGLINSRVEAEFQENQPGDLSLTRSALDFSIDQGNYVGGHTLVLIKLPPIQNLGLVARVQSVGDAFTIKKLELASSIGQVSGGGKFKIDPIHRNAPLDSMKISLSIRLTEDGVTAFGGWLATAAGNIDLAQKRSWQISIQKKPQGPLETSVTAA